MGTYVYAFNTRVRLVSGFKLALAEYRYKPHTTMFGGEEANRKLHTRTCGRRISFFENHPEQLPDYFVMGDELKEGLNVLVAKHGVAFGDYVKFEKAGTLHKVGRGWEIRFIEGYPKEVKQYKVVGVYSRNVAKTGDLAVCEDFVAYEPAGMFEILPVEAV